MTAEDRVAGLGTVARIAVITDQWRAGLAFADSQVAGFFAVADVSVVAFGV